MVQPPWDTTWQFLSKFNIHFPCDPVISFASIYPRGRLIEVIVIRRVPFTRRSESSPRHGSVGPRGQAAAALLLVCGPVSIRLLGAHLGDMGPLHQAPAWPPLTPDPCRPHLIFLRSSQVIKRGSIRRSKGALDVEEGN